MNNISTRPGKRNKRWRPIILALILSTLLIGCGSTVSGTWPDLVVDGETVYLVSGQVFALQADTGTVLWNYPGAAQRSGGLLGGCSAPQATDGPFTSAPAFDDAFVYIASAGERQKSIWGAGENKAGLRALNQFGTLQWKFDGTTAPALAEPTLIGNTIYMASSDHKVYAISVETQGVRWTFETENWVWATPLIVDETVYIASMDHKLYAINDETGLTEWTFDQSHSALPTAPAYAAGVDGRGVLYQNTLDGYIYAIDAQNGSLIWKTKIEGSVWASPLVEGDTLYLGTLQGIVYALSIQDGSTLWTQSVGGEVRSQPAFVDGWLYFGCEDGKLYVFNADDGTKRASPLGDKVEKASIHTTPVYDGKHLYVVATDSTVYALDLERNVIVWEKNPLTAQEEK
ncbi:MAG: PQQ-binding-like beta-propeller repeat protein [Anaerolineae bacterium]|nr:PQQ-binding-like beta-propeller repeat protein [Anaerolineae bacterium]